MLILSPRCLCQGSRCLWSLRRHKGAKLWSCPGELTHYCSCLLQPSNPLRRPLASIDVFDHMRNYHPVKSKARERERGLCSWFKMSKRVSNCPAWPVWSTSSRTSGNSRSIWQRPSEVTGDGISDQQYLPVWKTNIQAKQVFPGQGYWY